LVLGVIASRNWSGRDLVIVFRRGRDDDRFRADELGHFGIAQPVGGRDDDFIARIERGQHGVETGMLRAAVDDDLGRLVIEPVVGLELFADGGAQFRNAGGRRVLGEPGVERSHRRGLDVLGRVEVGLAGAEADDILAFGLHGLGLAIDGEGEGRGEFLDAGGGFHKGYFRIKWVNGDQSMTGGHKPAFCALILIKTFDQGLEVVFADLHDAHFPPGIVGESEACAALTMMVEPNSRRIDPGGALAGSVGPRTSRILRTASMPS
jgi:hypothetical protein